MKLLFRSLILTLILATSACGSFDRQALTKFEPVPIDEDGKTFKFVAICPPTYSVDAASLDEKLRIQWLEWNLAHNAFDTKNYQISERQVFQTGEGVIGKAYKIFYTVKVKMPNKSADRRQQLIG